jgi:hypothetical protein
MMKQMSTRLEKMMMKQQQQCRFVGSLRVMNQTQLSASQQSMEERTDSDQHVMRMMTQFAVDVETVDEIVVDEAAAAVVAVAVAVAPAENGNVVDEM